VRGLIDMQLVINKFESLAKQVDIADPYSSPIAQILDSKTLEDLIKEITDVPQVFDVFNAAAQATFGCDINQISALFTLAYANAAGGMMKLLVVENQSAQEFRVKGGTQQFSFKLQERIGAEKVLLNHVVQSIEQNDQGVRCTCSNGVVIQAKKVLVFQKNSTIF
jgi:monoamine oxidase